MTLHRLDLCHFPLRLLAHVCYPLLAPFLNIRAGHPAPEMHNLPWTRISYLTDPLPKREKQLAIKHSICTQISTREEAAHA